MGRLLTVTGLLSIALGWACDRALVEEGWPCSNTLPCVEGWSCGPANTCVKGGSSGGADATDGGSTPTGAPTTATIAARITLATPLADARGLAHDGSALWIGGTDGKVHKVGLDGAELDTVELPAGWAVVDLAWMSGALIALLSDGSEWRVHRLDAAGGDVKVATDANGVTYNGERLLVLAGTEYVGYDSSLQAKEILQAPTEMEGCVGPLAHGDYLFAWCGNEGALPDKKMTFGVASTGNRVDIESAVPVTIAASVVAGLATDGGDLFLLGGGDGADAGLVIRLELN